MVIRSEHTFAAGQADSSIYAKWVNQINAPVGSPAENCVVVLSSPSGQQDLQSCGSVRVLRQRRVQEIESAANGSNASIEEAP